VLIHENAVLSKRYLQAAWVAGFSHCRLVDQSVPERAAAYLTKYLHKEGAAVSRIRASIKYGSPCMDTMSEYVIQTKKDNKASEAKREALYSPVNEPNETSPQSEDTNKPSPSGSPHIRRVVLRMLDKWTE
jgi:hypothetical protein